MVRELNSKNKIPNTNNGITLIALVITIVVMLILVAVTINMAVNGGLFDYAGKAVGEMQNAIDAEQELANGKIKIGDVWYNSIDEYIKGNPIEDSNGEGGAEGNIKIELSIAGEKGTTVPIPTGFKYKEGTIDTGYVIVNETDGNEFVWVPVDANQKIRLKITSGNDIKSVTLKDPYGDTILTIEDGNIETTYNNTQIEPTVNGMYSATVETEEETVQETLVVRSLYALDTWNDWYTSEEFVTTMTGGAYTKEQFWEAMAQQEMGYESLEVAMETYDCNTIDEFVTSFLGLQNKQAEAQGIMFKDLEDYTERVNNSKGFYVGRYELGATKARTEGNAKATVEEIITESGFPVSKEGYYPYNFITFDQAIELINSMYDSSEFTESMITYTAWIRTLGWAWETRSINLKEIFVYSSNWGNYRNAEFEITKGEYLDNNGSSYVKVSGTYKKEKGNFVYLTTGATIRNSVNNIFDLAGNVSEMLYSSNGEKVMTWDDLGSEFGSVLAGTVHDRYWSDGTVNFHDPDGTRAMLIIDTK